ncbi:ATP-NAD/AcoX kinase [Beutenbergia cavernae DSM 12333]|uniref:NAD kinase n=1 Tax=Beutenbergia cavernae (strain ATCC BAA-8 / DSM 12333 / CCUG 43141 / JCM 11478 / NBRC 16432 / NCIMB 13614 / HKI 0122) TaxID=471853 RepID=C5BW05_BEUC1|nr:NAD kinase [Beutenbergia cavernae]ACQ80606.1 ATP-NAD/AcoX kinase [Beutenbergia cavernae DSM 12333]
MRRVLVVAHTGRADAVRTQHRLEEELRARGITPVHRPDLRHDAELSDADADPADLDGLELAVVLGGDGTILRAAELVRGRGVPLVGINLGHVGFLAESEASELSQVVDHIARRAYDVEERMTVDVTVRLPTGVVETGWAINEATVEKERRERLIEVAIGVDGRGLSTFGCDGVVLATPTGSTAYAFSAGGPVVWPDVEALLLVPISAHALFARPLVVGPGSVLAVEVLARSRSGATLWCDGRRRLDVPAGSHIEVRRGAEPVRIARLEQAPFSSRLVRKFDLPVSGWRGSGPAGGAR